MVSRGHLFPAQSAISCYRRQTYANRELVIVSANPDSMLADYVVALGDPSIRYIQVPPTPLGQLRNASVDAAHGDFVCTWDDDDLYGSNRLEHQIRQCLASNAAAHFLNRVLLWWPDRRLFGLSASRPWENTMLVRKDALPRYLPVAMREDTLVMREIESHHKVVTSDDPELYCYVVHSTNTCGNAHFEHIFEQAEWVHPNYDEELIRLSARYPIRAYADQMIAIKSNREAQVVNQIAQAPLISCSELTFGADELQVDGLAFRNCTFQGTQLVYLGGAYPQFENCELLDVSIRFLGSASNTLKWIRYLKNIGLNPAI